MLLGLGYGIYWLTTILAISLIISAAALLLNIGSNDGTALYAVAAMMGTGAVGVWLFGRAIYNWTK